MNFFQQSLPHICFLSFLYTLNIVCYEPKMLQVTKHKDVNKIWNFIMFVFFLNGSWQTFNDNYYLYWVKVCAFAKIFELVDTSLLIYQNKPVSRLHWMYHVSVLLYSWFIMSCDYINPNFYTMFYILNYRVNTVIYLYFLIPFKRFKNFVSYCQALQLCVHLIWTVTFYNKLDFDIWIITIIIHSLYLYFLLQHVILVKTFKCCLCQSKLQNKTTCKRCSNTCCLICLNNSLCLLCLE